jgi:uncharacterized protein (TIGR02246 family)
MDHKNAVFELMQRIADAWEHGDGAAYGSLFSEDAQYVTAPGERLHGPTAIGESHQRIFNTFFRETRLGRNYPIEVRALTPDVVLVEASGSVLFRGEKEKDVPPNGLMTLVVRKEGDNWRIVSFQNTPTGRMRNLRFMWRYLLSRFVIFAASGRKARRHMMEEKRKNLAKPGRPNE